MHFAFGNNSIKLRFRQPENPKSSLHPSTRHHTIPIMPPYTPTRRDWLLLTAAGAFKFTLVGFTLVAVMTMLKTYGYTLKQLSWVFLLGSVEALPKSYSPSPSSAIAPHAAAVSVFGCWFRWRALPHRLFF